MGLNNRPVFTKNMIKRWQVRVISGHKRNPIRINPLSISDGVNSSNTTGFPYTIPYHPRVIAPLGKMIGQLVTSPFKRLILRANSTESEGLAIWDISGKMFRMAAPRMQIHVGVSWFCIQISDNFLAISEADLDIQKIYFNLRLLTRELNVRVYLISMSNEVIKVTLTMRPNHKYVINVSIPHKRLAGRTCQETPLEPIHKYNGIGRGEFSSNSGTRNL